jgi:hypothetical protein
MESEPRPSKPVTDPPQGQPATTKKPYHSPVLREFGDIRTITQGTHRGTAHDRGGGVGGKTA